MLDADYIVEGADLLRAAARRLALECPDGVAAPSPVCSLALALDMERDGTRYTHLGVFPTPGIGTEAR